MIGDIIGWALVFAGIFFLITGSYGVLKFRDFFARLHPAGLIDSMGVPLILLGVVFLEGFTLIALKICVLIVLFLLTAPTACHALAQAAYRAKKD